MDSHTDSTVKPPKLSKQKSKSWYAGITHNINAPYMKPGYLIQHHVLETLSQGNTLSGCGDPCSQRKSLLSPGKKDPKYLGVTMVKTLCQIPECMHKGQKFVHLISG